MMIGSKSPILSVGARIRVLSLAGLTALLARGYDLRLKIPTYLLSSGLLDETADQLRTIP